MAKWISLPNPKFYAQRDQLAFLEARRSRWCLFCKKIYLVTPPNVGCPDCQEAGRRMFDRLTIIAGRRFGKGLSLDTPIPTPSGWTTIGTLQEGDSIFTETGEPTKILRLSKINHVDCYRITFSDGNVIIADKDHQWLVWTKGFRKALRRSQHPVLGPSIKTTPELTFTEDERDAIPLCLPLQYPSKQLPIAPYTLGAWLGDGSTAAAVITTVDPEILDQINLDGYITTSTKDHLNWAIGKKCQRRDPATGLFIANDSLHSTFKNLGLLHNKHIPADYLLGSIEQRLALLQGLMDTDGYCDSRGLCEFTNTNKNLAEGVYQLAISLGWRPSISEDRATLYGKDCGPKWRVFFWGFQPAFRLKRKLTRQQLGFSKFFPVRYITNVEKIPSVPTRCLEVDNPTSLFLAGRGCIPTHNSRVGSMAGVDESAIPNSTGWACAPTNPKLHRYVIPAFQQLIPKDWVDSYDSQLLDLRLKNGSLIHFQTLEDPDQGRGQGLDWLWIDEVCELTRKHWDVIRPSLAGDTVAFFTTTPRGFDWVYEELYEPAHNETPGYWACHARSADSANPRLSPDFLAREKAQMSDTMYRQEYEADFVTFTGSIYGDYMGSCVLHTDDEIKQFIPEWPDINPDRSCVIGIDTGADHPFGGIKLVSTEKGMLVVGEYLKRDSSYIQHAADLHRLASNTACKWAINKNEKQGILELAQHGIYCQKAENDQVAGIERVKSWLHQKQLWFVASRVPETIKQMKAYRWDENYSAKDEHKLKEKVYKKNDELPDALRYALMTWPRLPSPIIVDTSKRDLSKLPGEMRASIERMRRMENPKEQEPDSITGDFWNY